MTEIFIDNQWLCKRSYEKGKAKVLEEVRKTIEEQFKGKQSWVATKRYCKIIEKLKQLEGKK